MATTVNSAFNEFLKDTVNLDSDRTKKARSSRNWLVDQLKKLPTEDSTFPVLYDEKNIFFGSFARKTKKRPLDDIDIMICLSAEGGSGDFTGKSDAIKITINNSDSRLSAFCNAGTSTLNSRKIINKFISSLDDIDQYQQAEINRQGEAATLKLKSYEWNFDIVPCFFTVEDNDGKTYYLIPDGNGNWKKTDPRIDRDRVSHINQDHDGNILNVIRIMKYWNKRKTMPSMGSYLIENIILRHYEKTYSKASAYVDIEIPEILRYIRDSIYDDIDDPKGIQGNINHLSYDEKEKIWDRANLDQARADEARKFENENNHEASIKKWREIFGNEFPEYE